MKSPAFPNGNPSPPDAAGQSAADPAGCPLAIRLLGPWDVRLRGDPLPVQRSRRGQWLLALLVLQKGRPVERDWLAGVLWPDSREANALYNLRANLWDLRRALGPEAGRIRAPTPHTLAFDLAATFADVVQFDAAMARGDTRALEAAVELYRGPLLAGCSEEWVLGERASREQAYLTALETLAGQAVARGEPDAAARYARQAIATDPFRETAQRALMQALAASGNYAGVTLAYRDFRLRLQQELLAQPAPETQALFQQLRAEARRGSDVSPMKAAPSHRTPDALRLTPSPRRLPSPWSSFIGRESEIAEVAAALKEARLVTLTGTGGVGKTRLAVRVAQEIEDDYADGAWFVDLAGLSDPALVLQTVAAALEVPELPGRSLVATLQEFLHPKELLLVLDNCEHLVEACAQFAETLLSAAPHLRILATSRQSLGLLGEVIWRVPSLSLPAASAVRRLASDVREMSRSEGQGSRVEGPGSKGLPWTLDPGPLTLLQSDAVRLFVERARQADPTFDVIPDNIRRVAALCQRLDGIPLAIELAAARLKAMSLSQATARLRDGLDLLTGPSRRALTRQQTLQATMDWSYALLSEPEQALLRRLSVFAGGFTLEAAEAVCSGTVGSRQSAVGSKEQPTGGRPEEPSGLPTADCRLPTDVLDLLTALVDKSLVQYEEREGEGRYRLLETVRQYARDRLRESGEAEAVRARHGDFFVSYAERAEPVVGEQQGAWLERLESDVDNLRAALEWCLASQPEAALRMAAALGPFWELHGYFAEGRAFLERGLERAPEAPGEVRAKALGWAGHLAVPQGDWERAKELLEGSLALSRTVGDRRGIAASLLCLGQLARSQDNWDAAWGFIEESLAICREIGDPWGTANALSKLAAAALDRSDPEAARPLCVECLAIHRELGNKRGIADALLNLGWIAIDEGDYPAGQSLYAECLAIYREIGDKPGVFWALNGLGWAAELQGDYEAARGFFEERLKIAREIGSRRFVALSLWRLGDVAWAQGEDEAARDWYEESRALSQQIGYDRVISEVLDGLGSVACAQGEYGEARACFEESLRIRREAGWKPRMAASLEGLAKIAAAEGEGGRAARLLGAAEGLCAATQFRLSPAERADYERSVRAARSQLDAEAFAAAWAEGQGMTVEQAAAYALER